MSDRVGWGWKCGMQGAIIRTCEGLLVSENSAWKTSELRVKHCR
jgi:hypothetical protein